MNNIQLPIKVNKRTSNLLVLILIVFFTLIFFTAILIITLWTRYYVLSIAPSILIVLDIILLIKGLLDFPIEFILADDGIELSYFFVFKNKKVLNDQIEKISYQCLSDKIEFIGIKLVNHKRQIDILKKETVYALEDLSEFLKVHYFGN